MRASQDTVVVLSIAVVALLLVCTPIYGATVHDHLRRASTVEMETESLTNPGLWDHTGPSQNKKKPTVIFDFPPGYFTGGPGSKFKMLNPNKIAGNPLNLDPFEKVCT
jgi:hypothetical protein